MASANKLRPAATSPRSSAPERQAAPAARASASGPAGARSPGRLAPSPGLPRPKAPRSPPTRVAPYRPVHPRVSYRRAPTEVVAVLRRAYDVVCAPEHEVTPPHLSRRAPLPCARTPRRPRRTELRRRPGCQPRRAPIASQSLSQLAPSPQALAPKEATEPLHLFSPARTSPQ
jgi:hypothetical protein